MAIVLSLIWFILRIISYLDYIWINIYTLPNPERIHTRYAWLDPERIHTRHAWLASLKK